MKIQTPAANIIIGLIYLIYLGLVIFIMKLSLRGPPEPSKGIFKYNRNNIGKALNQQKYKTNIEPAKYLLKSLFFKYSIIGGIMNENKIYLLKEMLIVSIISVASTIINSIIFWPLTLIFPIFILSFVYFQIIIHQTWSQKKANQVNNNNFQIQHQIQNAVKNVKEQQQIKQKNKLTQKYITIFIIAFITLILLSQSMMMLFNSVSNLGLLNLGSVATMLAIDQLTIRLVSYGLVFSLIFIYNKIKGITFIHNSLFVDICSEQLLKGIHKIEIQLGTNQNLSMGASPTKKKVISPSKVPKAQLYFQSQTLMNLESTNRNKQENLSQVNENDQQGVQSPIRQLSISRNQSNYFTSAQKNIFMDQQNLMIQQSLPTQQKDQKNQKTLNPNQFFSAQRLPKNKDTIDVVDEDGLVLVQTGLNAFKINDDKHGSNKNHTVDVQFSPNKRKNIRPKNLKNKRQLIITGSSPYLQYLPDMMKKADRLSKKNTLPNPQNSTLSRKVL